jgi:hypothetical protein
MPMQMQMPITPIQSIMIPLPPFDMNLFNSLAEEPAILKQNIGNSIYSAIVPYVGEAFAGKITGMAIDETAVRQQMLMSDF